MLKIIPILVGFLPGLVLAGTTTVITPKGNYVVTTTPSTTYVIGPSGGGLPIAVTPGTQPHTYITPTGTYMMIPNGTGTTIIQTSGAR
jgi:hypothetical protein